jgi:hypothetical protein
MSGRARKAILSTVAGVLAAVLVTGGLLLTRPPAPPSAQCQGQVTQISAYQAEAQAISDSNDAVSMGGLAKFSMDVAESGALLNLTKREGCPLTGYEGGATLK